MKKIILVCMFIAIVFCSQAHPGVGIVMDSKGNVFYTDLTHVWKIDTNGNKSIVVRNVHTHELYMDEDDNLFGEHLWYEGEAINKWGHYVWQFSAYGTFTKIIPNTEGFLKDYSFVRDHEKNMYLANREGACQKISKLNDKGSLQPHSNSCLHDIGWITSSQAGVVYAIDQYDLKKINPNGKVETVASQLQERSVTQFFVGDSHQIMGLSVDKNENVFVAVYSARKVKKINRQGVVSTVAETNIAWSPTGVLIAPNGDLWILECSPTNAVRVERYTKDNRRIVY